MRTLVLATTIAVCLTAATAAGAATPRSFYGVVTANPPTTAEFQRLGQGRLGTLRINLSWSTVQPTGPGSFDWSRYDAVVGDAAQNGIRVLPTIYGSPAWAAAKPNHPPSASTLDEFEAFVRAAAERYGHDGTFWTLNPLIPKLPVEDWQLWNEVNSPSFWLPKPSAKGYKRLLVATERGLHSADPAARIVLAGLFLTPRIKNGIFLDRYLTQLYRLKTRGLFDAVAVHPYSTTPKRAIEAVRQVRELMRNFKDKGKPIWLTEVGWATAGAKTPLTVNLKRQASYLKQTFKLTAANRKRLKIAGVLWYSFKDLGGSVWFDNTGLFTVTGAAKPSWSAFAGLTGGTP